jgi:hypothetical protein
MACCCARTSGSDISRLRVQSVGPGIIAQTEGGGKPIAKTAPAGLVKSAKWVYARAMHAVAPGVTDQPGSGERWDGGVKVIPPLAWSRLCCLAAGEETLKAPG